MHKVFFKITLLLLIVFIQQNDIFALNKGSIESKVIDSVTSIGIPYASIELLIASDSTFVMGTTSDSAGVFVFNTLEYGNYLLRISYLGYEKKMVSNIEITTEKPIRNIGELKLQPDTKQLKEVSVVGKKLTGVVKGNKTIFQINDASAEIAQSGLELLRRLPDVTVSYFSDEVTLAGRNDILFQVNGRKVDSNYLLQLNPGLVDKIEVINNPGVEFDLETDAVINIILKSAFQKGISGAVRLNSSASTKTLMGKNNANIDYYSNNLRLYVAGKYKLQNYDVETESERTVSSPEASYLKQKTYANEKGYSIGINVGMDWFINKKNTFSVFSSIQPVEKAEVNSTINSYFSNASIEENSRNISNISDKKYFYDYSVYYSHNFQKISHTISFEAYRSNRINKNSEDYLVYEDENNSIISDEQNQLIESTNNYMYFKVHYVYPLSASMKFSTGYNNYILTRDYQYTDLFENYSDKIKSNEVRHATYANLSTDINKINIQAGIRYENSKTKITHKEDTLSYYNFFSPSLTVTYQTESVGVFRLSYKRAIGKPEISQLSPAVYSNDSYTQSSGNPDLKPSTTDRIELEHRIPFKNSMYINYKPYLSFSKDGIRQVKLFDTDSLETRKYINVSNQFEYGINISGLLSLYKIWMITPSATWYSKSIDALPEYGISYLKDNSWRLNLTSQLELPKKWTLFLEYNYEAPTIDYQCKKYAYYDFVFGFVKQINKKLTISAYTLNPWSSRYVYEKKRYDTQSTEQIVSSSIKSNHLIFLKLNYKFQSGKTGKSVNKNDEKEEFQKTNKGIFE
jgi:outer membrane receptor protein involved in Fe transport